MENHLQQQVAQLVAQIVPVSAINRIDDFVGFFQRIRRDGGEVLFYIPRAAAVGIAQSSHDRKQIVEAVARGFGHRQFVSK